MVSNRELSQPQDGEYGVAVMRRRPKTKIVCTLGPASSAGGMLFSSSRARRGGRHLWSSTPLVLNDDDLPGPARGAAAHPGHFRSVRLTDCRLDTLDGGLPEWPLVLAQMDTQKLHLVNGFIPDERNTLPRFPAEVLRCGSLEELLLGYWAFPRGASVSLPHLRWLTLLMVSISDEDLEHLITACPVLETLELNSGRPKRVRLRSGSLRCALVGLSGVEDFTVVDAPLLERLVLFLPGNGVRVEIGCAANLRVLGHLDTRVHRLQIRDIVIENNLMSNDVHLSRWTKFDSKRQDIGGDGEFWCSPGGQHADQLPQVFSQH